MTVTPTAVFVGFPPFASDGAGPGRGADPLEDEPIPGPPDTSEPLRRDEEEDDEGHPGIDPVTAPVPQDRVGIRGVPCARGAPVA